VLDLLFFFFIENGQRQLIMVKGGGEERRREDYRKILKECRSNQENEALVLCMEEAEIAAVRLQLPTSMGPYSYEL
jgi:hypothetical protein